jgi:hypothetical protein
MKLTTMTQVTVDGVMQGNGGASDEDRRSGFERGGWAMGVFDNKTFTFINETYQRADAFLAHRPRSPRPRHAALPRRRPGRCARPSRLASRLEGRNDPGLPAHRAPAVCNRHRRPPRRMTPAAASGDIPERWPSRGQAQALFPHAPRFF